MPELDVTIPQMGGKLDVLVNNAGVQFVSPLLGGDITQAKKLYDVRVWAL